MIDEAGRYENPEHCDPKIASIEIKTRKIPQYTH
jgi:hypothetical protein